jgi:hypothetical protein
MGLQGFAVETHDSGECRYVRGKLQRNRERITVRGLNDNHNKELKNHRATFPMRIGMQP